MKEVNLNNKRKDLISYLRGKNNSEGKKIMNLWFIKKDMDSSLTDNYSQEEFSDISIRIRSGIEAKIRGNEAGLKSNRFLVTRSDRQHSNRWLYMAASITIFMIFGTFLYHHSQKSTENLSGGNLVVYQIRHVPPGKKLKLELIDGSVIFLNSGSEFRFPENFNSGTREVYLKGEAYFEIARMPDKPFIVHTSGLNTMVLGTSFNIKAFDEEPDIYVTVATGKVQVKMTELPKGNTEISGILIANEQVLFSKTTGNIIKRKVSALEYLSWKDNILKFDNLSLAEIAVILERWFNVKIRFENEGLKNCYFIGSYKDPKLVSILEAISYSTGIQWEMEGREILLKGKGCILK